MILSSLMINDDDDAEKDEEDEEEKEHLAPADPSAVPTDDPTCITESAVALPSSSPPPKNDKSLKDNIRKQCQTVDHGDECEEIELCCRPASGNAIEAIAIYGQKTKHGRHGGEEILRRGQPFVLNAIFIHDGHALPNATGATYQRLIAMNVGIQGHYRGIALPEQNNQSHKKPIGGKWRHGVVHTLREGETNQDPHNIKDEIKA
ncbi:hypothetical protein Tco_0860938 [Tanacetum coccineum]|uniref:Uncharacterized protein n=1 Tax=Tanacetum coccineum TaxID=301880 RepID=A0ABQ5BGB9_9ASTR